MEQYNLETHTDKKTIFSGTFKSWIDCLETAVERKIDLTNINLKNKNLSNGNFDGAFMPGACLKGTNLSGANLSESCLRGSIFHHASLYNTCLCEADLRACDFRDSNFGATDIAGADISFSRFSTLSCFDLSFAQTQSMLGCSFESSQGHKCKMSSHPIVLKGIINTPIVIMDQTVKIGQNILCRETSTPLTDTHHAVKTA